MSVFDEESYQITLNASNVVSSDSSNAVYRYEFPSPLYFKREKVAVTEVSCYYSWYNITSALNNNTYQFTFTESGTTTTYTVTMPDGFYSVADLNTYLQSVCISNGLYLVDAAGDYVYYIEIVDNPTYYSIQLNNYAFPAALPSGYTNPEGLTFDGTAYCTQFIIPANAFQQVIGFNAATIPSAVGATDVATLSDFTPQVTPVESVILSCNLINNRYSNPPSLLYPFTAGDTLFGSLITSSPNNLLYLDCQDGYYNNIEIRFLDQSYNLLQLRDTNLVIQLAFIRDVREKELHKQDLNGHRR